MVQAQLENRAEVRNSNPSNEGRFQPAGPLDGDTARRMTFVPVRLQRKCPEAPRILLQTEIVQNPGQNGTILTIPPVSYTHGPFSEGMSVSAAIL
jgi:hypothetical protein